MNKLLILILSMVTISIAQQQGTVAIGCSGLNDSIKNNLKKIILKGNRTKPEIFRTAMINIKSLRINYCKRLIDKPNLEGNIAVLFRIISSGKVIMSSIYLSTVKDSILENIISNDITTWIFPKTTFNNDTTEAIYPFVFKIKK